MSKADDTIKTKQPVEHVFGIGYILEAAEFGYPFRDVARFILILAGCIILGMLYSAITTGYIAAKELPKVRRKVKMALYEKAREIDLECYDSPEYYNDLVLAISEADKQIDRCVTFMQNTAAGLSSFVFIGIYFLNKDSLSVLFVITSFLMAFFFNQVYNKLTYKIRIEKNPFERKREYVKRVFYLNDYAKDLYLYACETSLYVQKILDFMDYKPKITSEKNLAISGQAKNVELQNVSFSYGEKNDATINDISLTINPGEKLAAVGYNGAGKTTLMKLIMWLYDMTQGRILLDGVDIRDCDVEKYRNSIGTVFQDFKIFAGTVAENVLLDIDEGAATDAIKEALRHSDPADRIRKIPSGLNTPLTTEFDKEGMNLSGGESPKLAVGRVFFKNVGLIILDEPSSALDPIAEYQLNHSMLEATENKTVIFISHRLSTTRLADRIIMLENGQIVEQGSHEELLDRNGKYAQMWRAQAGQYIEI